jgi:hypothetical protein
VWQRRIDVFGVLGLKKGAIGVEFDRLLPLLVDGHPPAMVVPRHFQIDDVCDYGDDANGSSMKNHVVPGKSDASAGPLTAGLLKAAQWALLGPRRRCGMEESSSLGSITGCWKSNHARMLWAYRTAEAGDIK